MEMSGEAKLRAPRDAVWAALNDPAVLRASIPGCEALERAAEDEYLATVVSRVGPIKARFAGKVRLANVVAPRSYTLLGEGVGGAAGFAKAEIAVTLDPLEPQVTLLRYAVNANVGGKLAQLGSRMIDAAARKSADDFFAAFGRQVEGGAAPAPPGVLPAGAAAPWRQPATQPAIASRAPAAAPARPPAERTPADEAATSEVLEKGHVKTWVADGIAVVTLNRPEQRNAMTLAMWRAIPGILAGLDRDESVRAILLTGAGGDFCAGADISEFAAVRADAAQATDYEVAVDACCDAITATRKPTIAVLRGYCLGGGAHLAMSCDFRYAAASARFGIPAARLSIVYGVSATRKLLALVGLPRAKKILFGGQQFDAVAALAMGFVDHVSGLEPVRPARWWRARGAGKRASLDDDPMPAARAFAAALAENAPLSIAGAKYLLDGLALGTGSLDLARAEALIAEAAASEDYREGRVAFAEKRPPRFRGR